MRLRSARAVCWTAVALWMTTACSGQQPAVPAPARPPATPPPMPEQAPGPPVVPGSPSPSGDSVPLAALSKLLDESLPKIETIQPSPEAEWPEDPPHQGAMLDLQYRIQPPDMLRIEVLEALPGRPIQGERLVRPDGTINLGFYGDVHVRGLTLKQAKTKIILHLRRFLLDESLGLIGATIDAPPLPELPPAPVPPAPFPGLPEGANPFDVGDQRKAFEVGLLARVHEGFPARALLPPQAAKRSDPARPEAARPVIFIPPEDSDRVMVDVTSYNSLTYYLEGAFQKWGRMPITGSETVLDAYHYGEGFVPHADATTLRIVRPARGKAPARVLKVDFEAIRDRGDRAANYQLLPGDRLIVDPSRPR